jgi:hypothetical protein
MSLISYLMGCLLQTDKLSARVPTHKGTWEDCLHLPIDSFQPVAQEGTKITGQVFNCILFLGHFSLCVLVWYAQFVHK